MTRRKTAGRRLRERLDAALLAESGRTRAGLEWTPHELEYLRLACDAADRREALAGMLAAELTGQQRPAVAAKVSAEIRGCDRQITDLIGRVSLDEAPAKSARHQKAVRARWDRAAALQVTRGA